MPTKVDRSLVVRRAKDLAIVHLTRRDDLLVRELAADGGLDLLVEIRPAGETTGRLFGAQVKGVVVAKAAGRQDGRTYVRLPHHGEEWAKAIPFPVCLFLFAMEDDRGYYRWIKEPAPDVGGPAGLRLITSDLLAELTNDDIAAIVSRVNEWYDRREAAANVA